MQTILVPTDYSIVAQLALQYAAALASATRAKLILFLLTTRLYLPPFC